MPVRYAKRILVAVVLVVGALAAMSGTAFADKPDGPATGPNGEFLCPIVGDGVINADAHNGDNGVSAIAPAAGASLLPGNNQAGAHANASALNTEGPALSIRSSGCRPG